MIASTPEIHSDVETLQPSESYRTGRRVIRTNSVNIRRRRYNRKLSRRYKSYNHAFGRNLDEVSTQQGSSKNVTPDIESYSSQLTVSEAYISNSCLNFTENLKGKRTSKAVKNHQGVKQYKITRAKHQGGYLNACDIYSTTCMKRAMRNLFEGELLSILVKLFFLYILIVIQMSIFIIITIVYTSKNCIGIKEGDDPSRFEIVRKAFSLSWSTISTVGYGHVYPDVNDVKCGVVEIICVLESFIGLVYAGFMGSIFFTKISRVRDQAEVLFSDVMCIYFSPSTDLERGTTSKMLSLEANEYPVLVFRVANEKCNMDGGEIIHASVDCTIGKGNLSGNNELGAHPNTLKRLMSRDAYKKAHTLRKMMSNDTDTYLQGNEDRVTLLDPVCHYFKRTWYVYHKLDHNSNLLRHEVREEIEENNGLWPDHLLNYSSIRKSMIAFDELIVTINGSCNGHTVLAQNVYTPMDIIIGYNFVDMEKYDKSLDRIVVDLNLMDDVVEQTGGEAEPLYLGEELRNESLLNDVEI